MKESMQATLQAHKSFACQWYCVDSEVTCNSNTQVMATVCSSRGDIAHDAVTGEADCCKSRVGAGSTEFVKADLMRRSRRSTRSSMLIGLAKTLGKTRAFPLTAARRHGLQARKSDEGARPRPRLTASRRVRWLRGAALCRLWLCVQRRALDRKTAVSFTSMRVPSTFRQPART